MQLYRTLLPLPVWLRIAVPTLLLAACWILSVEIRRAEAYAASPFPLAPALRYHPRLVQGTSATLAGEEDFAIGATFPFEPGETLSDVLDGIGLPAAEAHQLINEVARFADLRRLKPRDQYTLRTDDSVLVAFELVLAGNGAVEVRRRGDGWSGSWRQFERSVRTHALAGVLEGSLESSIERGGGDARLAILMSEVLQWDLDFTRDLRLGDRFRVIYETVYLDGSYESLGAIRALAYDNDGRRLEAYRFGEEGGYYDAEGRPLRKMFLRSPMRYSRVTSRFSHRRFHPILKSYRPHYGVDYGAPVGTPVRSTANGRVVFAGWDRGGGKTVKIRHPNGYLTAYLHLSRFARGIAPGRRVSQGEVIAYVGSTGLATAPHLDYRVQLGGRWIDPMSLKSEPAEPLPEKELPAFFERRDALRRSLDEAAPDSRQRWASGAPAKKPSFAG